MRENITNLNVNLTRIQELQYAFVFQQRLMGGLCRHMVLSSEDLPDNSVTGNMFSGKRLKSFLFIIKFDSFS